MKISTGDEHSLYNIIGFICDNGIMAKEKTRMEDIYDLVIWIIIFRNTNRSDY